MIETRGTCAPHGRNIQEQVASPKASAKASRAGSSAKAAAVGRFLFTAARATDERMTQQELQSEEVAAVGSVKAQWYVDEQLRIPTEASAEAMAGLTWRGVRDEHGRLYYVHTDPKIASTYEKPIDYVEVWQEIPRHETADPNLDGTGRLWCDMMSGEVLIGEQPQQQEQIHGEKNVHGDETNEDSQDGQERLDPTTPEADHIHQAPAMLQGQNIGGEPTESCHQSWTEHEDEASGQPWWRNDDTGDETWVRPF